MWRLVFWYADFESDDLNNKLNYIDYSGQPITISSLEFEAAMTSFEEWESFVLDNNSAFLAVNSTNRDILYDFNPEGFANHAERNWNKIIGYRKEEGSRSIRRRDKCSTNYTIYC